MSFIRLITVFIFATLLGACSGGGGSSTSISTPMPGGSVTTTLTLTKTILTSNSTTTVKANFVDGGKPIQGLSVSFSAPPELATFNPLSGQATTDENGTATIQMTATNSTGVGQVTVSAVINGKVVSQISPFYLNTPQLHLGNLSYTKSVTTGGSLVVSADILDTDGKLYTDQNVDVYFSANYGVFVTDNNVGKVRSSAGKVLATYYISGTSLSSVTDTIKLTFGASTVTGNISINPLSAVNIGYVASIPAKTGLNYNETISFLFRVTDAKGNGVPGQTIDLAISGAAGSTLLANTVVSELDGTATAVLKAGSTNTTMWVRATLRGVGTVAESAVLYVAPSAATISVVEPAATAALGVAETMVIKFKVTDITGTIAVPNQSITMTVVDLAGNPTALAAIPSTSVNTDINGIASATLVTQGAGNIMVKGSLASGRFVFTPIISIKSIIASLVKSDSPASPTTLGFSQTAQFRFKVTDSTGTPVPNTAVFFGIVDINQILLNSNIAYLQSVDATSDANGFVTTTLQTRSTPTMLYVVCSLSSTLVGYSSSPLITVNGGGGTVLSLQATNLSIPSWTGNVPGTLGSLISGAVKSSIITASVSDASGVYVPDGTLVSFSTSGGSFTNSSCTTTNGTCFVTWNNTNPIASDGRAVITATSGSLTPRTETIVMSSVQPQISTTCGANILPLGDTNCSVNISDLLGNTMAFGTTAVFSANSTETNGGLSIVQPISLIYSFPNSNNSGVTSIPIVIRNSGCSATGSLLVKVSSSGVDSFMSFPLTSTLGAALCTASTATAPGAPTGVTATINPLSGVISVSFTRPANDGGSPITGYTVSSIPAVTGVDLNAGSILTTHTIDSSKISSQGSYAFTVIATNAIGSSAVSVQSNTVIAP